MKTTHTPGPWIVCEHDKNYMPGDFGLSIEQDGGRCEGTPTIIAEVDLSGDGLDHETGLANAALIAAAPDLLEALKWAAKNLDEVGVPLAQKAGLVTSMDECLYRARAAIAKAEGRGE